MDHNFVTTSFDIPGVRVAKTLGVVRGIVVRSRGAVGNMAAGFQMFFGGNISVYTSMCEQARADAYDLMVRHAEAVGANAIIGVRYDTTEIVSGATEILCYGTAVQIVPGGREGY